MRSRLTRGTTGALILLIASIVFGWTSQAGAGTGDVVHYGDSNFEDRATAFCLAQSNVCGGSGTTALIGQASTSVTDGVGVRAIGPSIGLDAFSNGSGGTGYGVKAQASESRGVGVLAKADTAIDAEGQTEGLIARGHIGADIEASDPSGIALTVSGPANFNRSGLVSIAFPSKSATVPVPDGLDPSSLVLATVQNACGVYVKAAVPNPATGTVKIMLSKAPGSSSNPKSASVAWFVVN